MSYGRVGIKTQVPVLPRSLNLNSIKEEVKIAQIGNEEVQQSLFIDDMPIQGEISNGFMKS